MESIEEEGRVHVHQFLFKRSFRYPSNPIVEVKMSSLVRYESAASWFTQMAFLPRLGICVFCVLLLDVMSRILRWMASLNFICFLRISMKHASSFPN